jgi:hypothetical protein
MSPFLLVVFVSLYERLCYIWGDVNFHSQKIDIDGMFTCYSLQRDRFIGACNHITGMKTHVLLSMLLLLF